MFFNNEIKIKEDRRGIFERNVEMLEADLRLRNMKGKGHLNGRSQRESRQVQGSELEERVLGDRAGFAPSQFMG